MLGAEGNNPKFMKHVFEGRRPEKLQSKGQDVRRGVKNSSEYPYCCVGMIIAVYQGGRKSTTGFLIGSNLVLTCAHGLLKDGQQPEKISFYPGINKKNKKEKGSGQGIRVTGFKFDKQNMNLLHRDIALLKLKEDIGKQYGYLRLNFDSQNTIEYKQLMMLGYSDWDQKTHDYEMHESAAICTQYKEDFIFYDERTNEGQSGGPIFAQINGELYAVGLHLGCKHQKNRANRLNDQKRKMIKQWANTLQQQMTNENHKFQSIASDLSFREASGLAKHLDDNITGERNIKEINLKCSQLTQNYLNIFIKRQSFAKIIKLDLSFNHISNEGIKCLKKYESLRNLNLFNNCLKPEALKAIIDTKLPLEVFDIGLNKIGDDDSGLGQIKSLEKLKVLNISEIGLTEEGLKKLTLSKNLHSIDLSGNKIGVNTLQILNKKWGKQLKKINVQNTNLKDQGIEKIKDNHKEITFPNLEHLNLSNNGLSNECVKYFPKVPLKWLFLGNNTSFDNKGQVLLTQKLGLKQIKGNIFVG